MLQEYILDIIHTYEAEIQADLICVKANQNGIIAQAFANQTLYIYNDDVTQKINVDFEINSIAYGHPLSMNPQYIYFFGQNIQAYDLEKQQIVFTLKNETATCGDLNVWNQICIAHEKTLVFWDLRTLQPFNCILAHSKRINTCKFNYTGKQVTTTAYDNYSRVFDAYQLEPVTTICLNKKNHVTSSQFTNDGKHILLSTLEQPLTLWNWIDGQVIAEYNSINQQRYFIEPIILYNDIPVNIIFPNDNNYLQIFNVLEPTQRQLRYCEFNSNPVRVEKINDEIFLLYADKQITKCKLQ
ncbi:hypothetical protein pb186bvf_012691 [Paramecium bursaria]